VPRRTHNPIDDKVTGADIIAFIEEVCFVPEGKYVGKRLELFEWQKAEIRRIYQLGAQQPKHDSCRLPAAGAPLRPAGAQQA
jgi:hypothetical protein